jgi:hypothetical protein
LSSAMVILGVMATYLPTLSVKSCKRPDFARDPVRKEQ